MGEAEPTKPLTGVPDISVQVPECQTFEESDHVGCSGDSQLPALAAVHYEEAQPTPCGTELPGQLAPSVELEGVSTFV